MGLLVLEKLHPNCVCMSSARDCACDMRAMVRVTDLYVCIPAFALWAECFDNVEYGYQISQFPGQLSSCRT